MNDILTPNQMKRAEQASVELGVSLERLMDNAGARLGRTLINVSQRFPKSRIVILAGNGNNAGDGFVAANWLAREGIMPKIILCNGEIKSELAKNAFYNLQLNLQVLDKSDARIWSFLYSSDIIVDCIFGTGFHGEFSQELSSFFAKINSIKSFKIACDVPSGVNSYSGQVCENTFKANETVTFHRPKLGMYISPAKEYCGKVFKADISIPDGWNDDMDLNISSCSISTATKLLPQRPVDSHKGTFGKCTLVCGSESYPGAAIISTRSALRSGVGIANLCTPLSVSSLACAIPEATFTHLQSDEQGFASMDNLDIILERLEISSSAVIGCGLGKTEDTTFIVEEIIKNAKCPLIIDADGINCLSEHIDVLKEKQTEIILTPHVGELARLCGVSIAEIFTDRLGYAKKLSDEYGVVVHSKSTQTFTIFQGNCVVTDFGCSALAKGGSGDMLAGLIGSLTAQGLDGADACILADYIMGKTANYMCETQSARGLLATDIISAFPKMLCQAERGVII